MPRLLALLLVFAGAVPSRAEECAFILSAGIDAVTVLDVARQRIRGVLPIGRRPSAIAIGADGATAWVAINEENRVARLDLASGRVRQSVAVGEQPTDVVLTPDGRSLLVSERRDQRVAVIDVASGAVTGHIGAGGSGPAGLVVTADGSRAYVANSFSNNVGILDLVERRNRGTIPVGEYPFDLALSPDETRLYSADVQSGTVTVLDRAAGTLVTTIAVGGNPIGIAAHPGGALVYAANAPLGEVTVIDAATYAVVTAIDLGVGEADLPGIALSGDGGLAFTVDYGFANLYAIDTATQLPRWFAPAGGLGTAPENLAVAALPGRCPTSPPPRLTAAIDAAELLVPLERADLLPAAGTLRIDDELLTYDGRQLRVAVRVTARGVAGSAAAVHAEGRVATLVGASGDANCDGPPTAADLTALLQQVPVGDPGPCGADVMRDGVVRADDLPGLIATVFDPP
ncbi:MAG: hypothetical protein SF182_15320 [Deltaproteobacteria bacterium]|nr:hypothetical protein [Deltaproteobacteria bacterium]